MQAAVYDSYPHAEGLTQLCERTGCDVVELATSHRCPASVAAAHTLTADPVSMSDFVMDFGLRRSAYPYLTTYRP